MQFFHSPPWPLSELNPYHTYTKTPESHFQILYLYSLTGDSPQWIRRSLCMYSSPTDPPAQYRTSAKTWRRRTGRWRGGRPGGRWKTTPVKMMATVNYVNYVYAKTWRRRTGRWRGGRPGGRWKTTPVKMMATVNYVNYVNYAKTWRRRTGRWRGDQLGGRWKTTPVKGWKLSLTIHIPEYQFCIL